MVQDDIVRLCVVVESGDLEVGILLAQGFFLLAIVAGGIPLGLWELEPLVDVQGHHHKVFLQARHHLRIRPYILFHLATVHTAVAGEVNEQGFSFSLCSSKGLFVVEVTGDAMRDFE